MLCSHASNFAILSGSISSVIYQPPIRHDHRSKSLVKERSKVQEKTRTGEEVGASVVVSEHGEHILDAAARRRVRLLTLLGSVPARPSQEKWMLDSTESKSRAKGELDEREAKLAWASCLGQWL